MTSTVTFGSLPMQTVPATGVYIIDAKFFQDWYTVSDSKTAHRERVLADGAFGVDRVWRAALPLTMRGRFRGPSWPSMLAALRAAASTGRPVTVTVSDPMGVSSRTVTVEDFVPYPNPGAGVVNFDLVMVAEDPLMYGQTVSTTPVGPPTAGTGQPWPQVWPATWGTGGTDGRATAANSGGAATPLKVTVTGDLSGGVELACITNGRFLRLERVIPAGSAAIFDAALGRAYLDTPSNDITGFMTRREWEGFLIPAGGSSTVQFTPIGTPTGSPTMTLTWAPAN